MSFQVPGQPEKPPEPKLLFEGQMFNSPKKQQQQDATAAFSQYKIDGKLDPVMKSISPMMDKSLRRYIGNVDPLSRAEAKRLIIGSIDRYDPSKASLSTFVDRQLQPMQRWQSRRSSVTKLPDRKRMEAISVGRASRELERELGRPPSLAQIADRTGMSQTKIEKIRSFDRQTLQSSMEVGDGENTADIDEQAVNDDVAAAKAWERFVYDDLGAIDQQVLEHTTGYGGSEILSNKALAAKLRISPGAVSQRKAKIQAMLDRGDDLNPFG